MSKGLAHSFGFVRQPLNLFVIRIRIINKSFEKIDVNCLAYCSNPFSKTFRNGIYNETKFFVPRPTSLKISI